MKNLILNIKITSNLILKVQGDSNAEELLNLF